FVLLRHSEALEFILASRGPLFVAVDGKPIFRGDQFELARRTIAEPLPSGLHTITIRYDKPSNTEAHASVSVRSAVTGRRVGVFPIPVDPRSLELSRWLTRATNLLGILAALLLIVLVLRCYWPPHSVLSLLIREKPVRFAVVVMFTVLLSVGVSLAHPFQHRTVILWAGDDPLVYETNARDVLLNGVLMPGGSTVGG